MTAAGHLHRRLSNHLSGKSFFAESHLNGDGAKLRGSYSFQYLEVPDERLRALLEAYAIGHLCPTHVRVSSQPDHG
jgi:hypothetical protein